MNRQGPHIIRGPKHPYGVYSDGNQGAVVYDGSATILGVAPAANVYILTADTEVTDMTINAGVTVKCDGYVPRVNGVLWVKSTGRLTSNQNDASGITAGASLSNRGSTVQTSAAGGAGRSTTGVGNNGTGSGSRNITGARSGNGGASGTGQAGGAGNNTVAPTASLGKWRNWSYVTRQRLTDGTGGNGSGGGGGGGCDVGTGTANSGAGGSAALNLYIFCRYLRNEGTIDANGGAGSNASATGNGAAGGGGGGAPGAVFIVTDAIIAKGTIQANAGTNGTGIGGGASGGGLATSSFFVIMTPNGTVIG